MKPTRSLRDISWATVQRATESSLAGQVNPWTGRMGRGVSVRAGRSAGMCTRGMEGDALRLLEEVITRPQRTQDLLGALAAAL